MLKNRVETFTVNNCPGCGGKHYVEIEVFRDILPNNMNEDIRVPEFHKVNVGLRCPDAAHPFKVDLFIQEDVYSKIIKLKRPS